MRSPISNEDVEELEYPAPDHRAVAQQLLAWAGEPHPDDEVSPRELLTRAGEQLELADDVDGALALYLRAVDTDGDAILDPRAHLVSLYLGHGEREEALAHDRGLRRSKPESSANYEYLGEVWAEHGDLQRALGWYTRGILRHEQGPPLATDDLAMLCLGRWQVREQLGHHPDDYDLIGIGMRRRAQERWEQAGEETPAG